MNKHFDAEMENDLKALNRSLRLGHYKNLAIVVCFLGGLFCYLGFMFSVLPQIQPFVFRLMGVE